MRQHTWFVKSKELFDKQEKLYARLESYENDEIYLDEAEYNRIQNEIDEIEELNEAEFHDLFRTGKRNSDKSYIDEVITSKSDCFKWIENPENHVSFKNTIFDDDAKERENREYAYRRLNEFWDLYPNGLIYFL